MCRFLYHLCWSKEPTLLSQTNKFAALRRAPCWKSNKGFVPARAGPGTARSLWPPSPELAEEQAMRSPPSGSAAVKGPLCDRGGIRHESQCSLVRGASWSCRAVGGRGGAGSPAGQGRRKGAILWWFPWPNGPGGGSHVSRPELEPGLLPQQPRPWPQGGQECESQQHHPPWATPVLRWGDQGGRLGLARRNQALHELHEDETHMCNYS